MWQQEIRQQKGSVVEPDVQKVIHTSIVIASCFCHAQVLCEQIGIKRTIVSMRKRQT